MKSGMNIQLIINSLLQALLADCSPFPYGGLVGNTRGTYVHNVQCTYMYVRVYLQKQCSLNITQPLLGNLESRLQLTEMTML